MTQEKLTEAQRIIDDIIVLRDIIDTISPNSVITIQVDDIDSSLDAKLPDCLYDGLLRLCEDQLAILKYQFEKL